MADNKECFVISPIGSEGSEIRERADKLLNHVIKKAANDCGYDTTRADEIEEPGQITTQVIQRTVNSELVIADLTNQNPNVFYELAIRHAAREPVIQLIEKGNEIPFDVHMQRTIKIDIEDLDSVETAKTEIKDQINALEENDREINSPVSMAMDIQFWEKSGDPQQQELAEVIEMIADMRSEMNNLRSELNEVYESNEFDEDDIQKIIDIWEEAKSMNDALEDVKNIAASTEFESKDEKQNIDRAINYLKDSVRDIERRADDFLKKNY